MWNKFYIETLYPFYVRNTLNIPFSPWLRETIQEYTFKQALKYAAKLDKEKK